MDDNVRPVHRNPLRALNKAKVRDSIAYAVTKYLKEIPVCH